MTVTAIIASICILTAGTGVFIVACDMMSVNLQALCGRRIKILFEKSADKKLVGVFMGAAATAAIQSSGATAVAVIGFVNAGVMTLAQAASVVFGANIGTTVTAHITALGMFGGTALTPAVVLSALAGAGALISALARRESARKAGGVIAGFGLIFVGLSLMSEAMAGFAASHAVRSVLATFEAPLFLVFAGMLMTAIVQSSSVVTSVTLTMTVSGLMTVGRGVYIVIGSNIGTCVTAFLASAGGGKNALRVALMHLLFNVAGAILFTGVGIVLRFCGTDYGSILETLFPHAPQTQLAVFHTVFNVAATAVMLPLTDRAVGLVKALVPDTPRKRSVA